MKKVSILLLAIALFSCEKEAEQKSATVNQPPAIVYCDCYVYELESRTKIVNGVPVLSTVWVQGRYWGNDCSDNGHTFQENGGKARQVRCTEI